MDAAMFAFIHMEVEGERWKPKLKQIFLVNSFKMKSKYGEILNTTAIYIFVVSPPRNYTGFR